MGTENDPLDPALLPYLYRERFAESDIEFKRRAWRVLCERVFQRYVGEDDTVLDLGAGRCEFINAIRCGRKIAVDLNPDVKSHAVDAEVVISSSTELSPVGSASIDVVFSSNFLEHLPSKRAVLETFAECRRILRPDGTLILLMPNMRYLHGRYWDYFDHHTALTHYSVVEALRLSRFAPLQVTPRFLPYTVRQGSIPRSLLLLRLYLRLRAIWPLLGKQMLVVARPRSD